MAEVSNLTHEYMLANYSKLSLFNLVSYYENYKQQVSDFISEKNKGHFLNLFPLDILRKPLNENEHFMNSIALGSYSFFRFKSDKDLNVGILDELQLQNLTKNQIKPDEFVLEPNFFVRYFKGEINKEDIPDSKILLLDKTLSVLEKLHFTKPINLADF